MHVSQISLNRDVSHLIINISHSWCTHRAAIYRSALHTHYHFTNELNF